jgi:hypothetical protein
LRERRGASRQGIVFVGRSEPDDAQHAVALLRARCERPRRRAAKERDELAPLHSITSSARQQPCFACGQGCDHDDPDRFGVNEDQVMSRLVASLARPGGNTTGIYSFLADMWFTLSALIRANGLRRASL